MQHQLLGEIVSDPVGVLIKSGYMRFDTPHCAGLVHETSITTDATHLQILAIVSRKPNSGQFRDFIHRAQALFATISIWAIWNEDFACILKHYGFVTVHETDQYGDPIEGMRWTK